MRVLVTGGAGYIGSVTTRMLADHGHSVVVVDNLERGHRAAIDSRAEFVQADLRDPRTTRLAVREASPDAVVHFAAYAYVGESIQRPEVYFQNNLGGAVNLVAAMVEAGVERLVFSSTCAVYGHPETQPIGENSPRRPINPYGESKRQAEKVFEWHAKLGKLQPAFLRYFNAAGASGDLGEHHDPEPHLIPLVLQVAQGQNDRITIFGSDYETRDGTCVRDYVHIEDLASAHVLALEKGAVGAFNLGTGSGFSVLDVIAAARAVTGEPIEYVVGPRRPGDPPRLVAAAEKAHNELGWKPRASDLERILGDAWRWHNAHPNGYPE